MINKHGRYIFGEIHEVRKGLWAFFLDCAADWLGRQTPITWISITQWCVFTKRSRDHKSPLNSSHDFFDSSDG